MAEQSSTGQALTPGSPNALQPPTGSYGNANGLVASLRAFIKQPAVARAMPLIIMSAVMLAAITAWLVLREPPQRDLFRGLPDNDKSAVMQALEVANIAYEVDDDTGTLTVSNDDYHSAKIELAGQGLPRSAPSGDTVMSSMPMGASRAVESEKLRNAREMDLARSIEAIDSVVSARVHLAVEQPSIFLRDRNEPSASVILHLASSTRLDEKETQAILNLVASSVPGLSASNVSVIDQNGRLLSSSSDGLSSGTDTQLKVKAAIEDRYRQSLASLLTPLVGPGNFVAEVTADVNFDEKQATSETYPLDGSILRSEQGKKSNETAGNDAGGIPGALANRPPAAAEFEEQPGGAGEQGANATEPRKSSEEYRRNFELAREVAVTNQAPGQVSRLSVAVAIDDRALKNKKSPKEIQEIEKLIKGTVGYSLDRGDLIAVTARRFNAVADEPVTETWYETSWFSMLIRNLSALLVALLLIFGIGRPVLKRWQASEKALRSDRDQKALAGNGTTTDRFHQDGTEDGGLLENQTAGALGPAVTVDMITSAKSYQERAILTQNFVKQNPDQAALVVKELLKESDELEEVDG
ncbi:flagellar basal-body MS-ring/collar protein FliF [uncultured Parasphingorhabdus sp.]|uniref:flagellar basal-body MS-ring/collar protein FliF n=1 Tax=uncultured Parasphingorhabdus sp. TaxID=2709694 RepID=UPI0030D9B457|tara:strand:+ start:75388 stop:77136 length:1749 start_codon:yes stop_codon:yes gene_type:complete